jgi:hypothetical protein
VGKEKKILGGRKIKRRTEKQGNFHLSIKKSFYQKHVSGGHREAILPLLYPSIRPVDKYATLHPLQPLYAPPITSPKPFSDV